MTAKKLWFALNVFSGREASIRDGILKEARKQRLTAQVGQVVAPTEKIRIQTRGKLWKLAERQKFGGYIFVEIRPTAAAVALLRGVDGVFGLLPNNDAPVALSEAEVLRILADARVEKRKDAPARILIPYEIGDPVKITDGMFQGQEALVKDIDEPRPGAEPVVTVMISLLGRTIPTEIKYWQATQL